MGKLIVIDGLDGSGKTTQFELIQKILSDRGITVKAISFPEYDKPSSTLVKMYLGGEFSKNAEDVNAYASSSFYAVDRYASYKLYWEKDYLDDKLILASRYVSSNAIHQMVKLPEEEWEKYLEWLIDYEHIKMDIPKADKVIFLDMPIEISQKLLSYRYNGDENKKDIHESNVEYLYRCRKSALFAAEKLGWYVVTCNDGENPLPTEEISNKIMKIIDEVI
ncbi:MAG: deoxynucleoside kinase [Oscillospiraceae bacterium]|nr:deoxynucleoside kinase [Oscillospiraceae bacterium]